MVAVAVEFAVAEAVAVEVGSVESEAEVAVIEEAVEVEAV